MLINSCEVIRVLASHSCFCKNLGSGYALKYQPFPFTGLEMMEAHNGSLLLLPGTFESLGGTGLVQPGAYDVALLWTVSEHLTHFADVLRGIFDYLKPGDLLCVKHHNFYGYDGHHGEPKSPSAVTKEFRSGPMYHRPFQFAWIQRF